MNGNLRVILNIGFVIEPKKQVKRPCLLSQGNDSCVPPSDIIVGPTEFSPAIFQRSEPGLKIIYSCRSFAE